MGLAVLYATKWNDAAVVAIDDGLGTEEGVFAWLRATIACPSLNRALDEARPFAPFCDDHLRQRRMLDEEGYMVRFDRGGAAGPLGWHGVRRTRDSVAEH